MRVFLGLLAIAAASLVQEGRAEGTTLFSDALMLGLKDGVSAHSRGVTPTIALGEGMMAVKSFLEPHRAKLMEHRAEGERLGRPVGSLGHNSIPGPYYRVIPSLLGTAPMDGSGTVGPIASRCFSHVVARVIGTPPSGSAGQVTVEITATGAVGSGCEDLYLLGVDGALALASVTKSGQTNATITVPSTLEGAPEAAWAFGVNVMNFICDGDLGCAGDLLDTVGLFVPSLTEATLDAKSMYDNLNFLAAYTDMTFPNRSNPGFTPGLDESQFQTGDFIALRRPDGLASLEMFGTGAETDHTAMFIRMPPDNSLYVVESTDKTSYWPNPNIQKTLYDPTWKAMALAANYSIAILPPKAELRAKWNQTGAELYIASALGDPYGYKNFLWTFFDTPTGNLPWPATWQAVENLFAFLNTISPPLVEQFVGAAMGKRLGVTTQLTVPQMALAAKKTLGISFGELMSIPENDSWVYNDGPSLVCDSFVTKIYQSAGLFDGFDNIQAAEFTNNGIYNVNFFDLKDDQHDPRPDACKAADPDLPYCMLMGATQIVMPNASTIAPYSGMQQHCSAQAPKFIQPEGC